VSLLEKTILFPYSSKLMDGSWTAVVRGAVMRGLEGETVRVRKVARNYGNSYSTPFIAGLHSETDSYIDEYDGMRMCGDRMRWYIMKVRTWTTSFFGSIMITEFRAKMLS